MRKRVEGKTTNGTNRPLLSFSPYRTRRSDAHFSFDARIVVRSDELAKKRDSSGGDRLDLYSKAEKAIPFGVLQQCSDTDLSMRSSVRCKNGPFFLFW